MLRITRTPYKTALRLARASLPSASKSAQRRLARSIHCSGG